MRRREIAVGDRNFGRQLLNQQLWCWGYDIRRADGNLLLDYGFERHRPPADQTGSSAYRLRRGKQRDVTLWAFGVAYHEAALGTILLRRFEFQPLLLDADVSPVAAWDLDALTARDPGDGHERRRVRALLPPLLRWVGAYERWIAATVGVEHRAAALGEWPRAVVAAERLPQAWDDLAERISGRWLPPAPPVGRLEAAPPT